MTVSGSSGGPVEDAGLSWRDLRLENLRLREALERIARDDQPMTQDDQAIARAALGTVEGSVA